MARSFSCAEPNRGSRIYAVCGRQLDRNRILSGWPPPTGWTNRWREGAEGREGSLSNIFLCSSEGPAAAAAAIRSGQAARLLCLPPLLLVTREFGSLKAVVLFGVSACHRLPLFYFSIISSRRRLSRNQSGLAGFRQRLVSHW